MGKQKTLEWDPENVHNYFIFSARDLSTEDKVKLVTACNTNDTNKAAGIFRQLRQLWVSSSCQAALQEEEISYTWWCIVRRKGILRSPYCQVRTNQGSKYKSWILAMFLSQMLSRVVSGYFDL